jgi:3,4-dihydroxy 2-butanone 4-phosphate synthase / GTP cyclohydrolase II
MSQPIVSEAIQSLKNGYPVIIMDDDSRENEGDFIMPVETLTTEWMNIFLKHSTGIICCSLSPKRAADLELNYMVQNNNDPHHTNFTISVDGYNTTTGVSSEDRVNTLKCLLNGTSSQLRRPGHIYPLVANPNLLQSRRGHTEASMQLSLLAEFNGPTLLTEIQNEDGRMARLNDCKKIAQIYNLCILSIQDIVDYCNQLQIQPTCEVSPLLSSNTNLTTQEGLFVVTVYKHPLTLQEAIVVQVGEPNKSTPILRIHSECMTSHILHSLHCDCQEQFWNSIRFIKYNPGSYGYIIYLLEQEGRGIGLLNKIKAYQLQSEHNTDTVDANLQLGLPVDSRNYDLAVQICTQYLNIQKEVQLITNNPEKIKVFSSTGINVSQVTLPSEIHPVNEKYLLTKRNKCNHTIYFKPKQTLI